VRLGEFCPAYGGHLGFQVTGMIKGYLEVFEIFNSESLFVGKFGKYFWRWLDISRDILAIRNNLKICGSVLAA